MKLLLKNEYEEVEENGLEFARYFQEYFEEENEKNKNLLKESGFANIDAKQKLTEGMYVLGGNPGVGKTTFSWQLINQMAESGEKCIYCTTEMKAIELYSKTAARYLYLRERNKALTTTAIKSGEWSQGLDNIMYELKQMRLALKVVELQEETVEDVINLLKKISKESEKAPVICLDYLQGLEENAKDIVKLKQFQRETQSMLIMISGFRRKNYTEPAMLESFKGNGEIECSADVVWALQYYEAKMLKKNDAANYAVMEKCKKGARRKMNLKCLKNRYGEEYEVNFDYYAAHDCFVSCDEK